MYMRVEEFGSATREKEKSVRNSMTSVNELSLKNEKRTANEYSGSLLNSGNSSKMSSASSLSSSAASDCSMRVNYFPSRSSGQGSAESWERFSPTSLGLNKMSRYSRYQIYYYGSPAEKETANKEMREILKTQQELILPHYREFVNRVAETKEVEERVRMEEIADREKRRQHYQYMTTFRDGNKMLMEYNRHKKKEQRQYEIGQERRRLTLNPINWNHTLW